jgi:SOS-response transcriptional repressors (RecA-mediated autopeptidases)
MSNLTPRQQSILDFIRKYIAKKGYSPSIQEITDGVGLVSTGNVHRVVKVLQDKGHIDREDNIQRTIRVIG